MIEAAATIAQFDQASWADVLDELRTRLPHDPYRTAREILALYEGSAAHSRVVIQGNWALDTVMLTRAGAAYKEPGIERERTFRYMQLLRQLYAEALAMWLDPNNPRPRPPVCREPTVLADYGGGAQIWAAAEGYSVHYDCGHLASVYRRDAISRDEAEHGMMGTRHFNHLVISVQNRLKAAGVDPHLGNGRD